MNEVEKAIKVTRAELNGPTRKLGRECIAISLLWFLLNSLTRKRNLPPLFCVTNATSNPLNVGLHVYVQFDEFKNECFLFFFSLEMNKWKWNEMNSFTPLNATSSSAVWLCFVSVFPPPMIPLFWFQSNLVVSFHHQSIDFLFAFYWYETRIRYWFLR